MSEKEIIFIGEHKESLFKSECQCQSPYHTIHFYKDEDEFGKPCLSFEILLTPQASFWQRIKEAVSYIFKSDRHCGTFDCWYLTKEDLVRLEQVIKNLKQQVINIQVISYLNSRK